MFLRNKFITFTQILEVFLLQPNLFFQGLKASAQLTKKS